MAYNDIISSVELSYSTQYNAEIQNVHGNNNYQYMYCMDDDIDLREIGDSNSNSAGFTDDAPVSIEFFNENICFNSTIL